MAEKKFRRAVIVEYTLSDRVASLAYPNEYADLMNTPIDVVIEDEHGMRLGHWFDMTSYQVIQDEITEVKE